MVAGPPNVGSEALSKMQGFSGHSGRRPA